MPEGSHTAPCSPCRAAAGEDSAAVPASVVKLLLSPRVLGRDPSFRMLTAEEMAKLLLSPRVLGRDPSFRMLTSEEMAELLQAVEDVKDATLSLDAPPIVNLCNLGRIRAEIVDRETDEEHMEEWTTFSATSDAGSNCNPHSSWSMESADSVIKLDRTETVSKISTILTSAGASRCYNTVVFGIVGGATGAIAGAAAGAVSGIPPAILTFGLSVPSCVGAGAAAGFCAGGIVGAGAGFKGANMTIAYKSPSVPEAAEELKNSDNAQLCICIDIDGTQQMSDACKRRRNVTLASAVGGGVVMGSLGGASGTAVGGLVGATIGLIPAPFTMGLSIPISAAIGTSLGCFTGTLAGASAGFVGGGVAAKTGFACANMRRCKF